MEKLPDEALLTILQRLPIPDLLSVRVTCKKLAELALNPRVWRRKVLATPTVDKRWTCPVLRLAPCLRNLHLYFSPESCHCAANTTTCAVEELCLVGSAQSWPMDAALALTNLRRNGDIKYLFISFASACSRPQLRILLDTVATTTGLEELTITNPYCKSKPNEKLVARPSLKKLDCGLATESARFCNAVLSTHASTLEEVNLLQRFNIFPPTSFSADQLLTTAPLLANLKLMKELHCPMLPGLEAVAALPSLKKVTLSTLSGGSLAAASSTALFLKSGKYLLDVKIIFSEEEVLVDLFEAMASCRQSALASLAVHGTDEDLPQLIASLPSLASLHTLEFSCREGFPSDTLLQAISPASSPALRLLRLIQERGLGPNDCAHKYIHESAVTQVLRVNPLLHLTIHPWDDPWSKYCRVRHCQPCKWCEKDCRLFFEKMAKERRHFLGIYTHAIDMECSVDHKAYGVSWLHQPSFYSA